MPSNVRRLNFRDHDWRNSILFLAGPALVTFIVALVFRFNPWPVPIPAQGQILQLIPVGFILGLGCIGVTLSPLVGLPGAPALADLARWRSVLIASLVPGFVFGATLFWLDATFGIASSAVANLGATWVNLPLPQSLGHFAAAAVLVECVYRLIPIPIFTWLVSRVGFRGRFESPTFWALAILTSLVEPVSQLGLKVGLISAALASLIVLTFAANLFEARHLRRHGWPAPILFRLSFYAVWHCFGPYLLSPSSILYPGQH